MLVNCTGAFMDNKRSNKKPIRVFEAFAGLGTQVIALRRAHIPHISVGISEWFVDAIIAYDALNSHNEPVSLPSYEKQIEYLSKFTFSINSQEPLKRLNSLSKDKIARLYIANKRSKNLGSICDIKPKDMPKNIDLLTYSFPCQDLSTGGKTAGMARNSHTRSGLLWEVERLLLGMKEVGTLPKYLLLENVPTIIAKSNINDLNEWLEVLNKLGYSNSKPVILNAADFGVRQSRKRCIIFSVLDEKPIELDGNLKIKKLKPINDFYRCDYTDPILKAEADEASLNPTPSRLKMWEVNKRDPVSTDTIFYTVTCNLDRSNNCGMVRYEGPHGRPFRLLTSREIALLMGFNEEEYEKIKSLDFSYRRRNKLIGNSIVIDVLKAVFEYAFSDRTNEEPSICKDKL